MLSTVSRNFLFSDSMCGAHMGWTHAGQMCDACVGDIMSSEKIRDFPFQTIIHSERVFDVAFEVFRLLNLAFFV